MDQNPLLELQKRSHARGACDDKGRAIGFPTPWAFMLATHGKNPQDPPAIRSLGFQVVDVDGIVFVARGAPGGATGCDFGKSQVSMCHLAGNYPGAGFEEQWRAEGLLQQLSWQEWEELMKAGTPVADAHSLEAQMVACSNFEQARSRESGGLSPVDASGRLRFKNPAEVNALKEEVRQIGADIEEGRLGEHEIENAGLRIYRLKPTRMEVLCGGPQWPQGPNRFEWTYDGRWQGPSQILPYSFPQSRKIDVPALAGALVHAEQAVDISNKADETLNNLMRTFHISQLVQVQTQGLVACILQNTGSESWPSGTSMKLVQGAAACGISQVDFDEIEVHEVIHVSWQVDTSSASHWVLCSPCGRPFGCLLSVIPSVGVID
eukprot:TRINITY_DN94684_c0_g1_i1.p1 TRINITY_DN94684_c0_g1~~TRINITY_DN94684_c0_g1_i1.p1  ORF type:complete len:378 (-),score=54.46 TRINITY_DN94684_c0_g1_i1:131-1264(-)